MTRRDWFLQVGAGVALSGCAAADLDAAADLPPGVYEASRDHLSHALAGHRLAEGTETELVQIRTGEFRPAFFQAGEYGAVVRLTAELLGEAADAPIVHEIAEWLDAGVAESAAVRSAALAFAPGHRTLAVHFYGVKDVRHLEEFDPRVVCRQGLVWLGGRALGSISDDRPAPHEENAGTRFFAYFKARVIQGFYTSRVGLEELGSGNYKFSASPPGCAR